ncbi:hypothetical protein TcasGA2_TC032450 [Tribolium castaneum]|uniref:Uncharacterized protein n=1 Tax=Tribolium castaneum TaxID=7070 RepID=A0A139WL21_TRICA|nr:hypothetical protein TcasGA2_TC032450 [Tribolium castaneum]
MVEIIYLQWFTSTPAKVFIKRLNFGLLACSGPPDAENAHR